MDALNIKMIVIAVLVCIVLLLSFMVILQRKKRGRARRSMYIEALYALIKGEKDDAYTLLTSAVRNGEDDVDAYIQLGDLMRERGQAEKALQLHRGLTVRTALTFDDEKAIQLAIAKDLASLGKIERAVAALESVRKKGRDVEVLSTLHRLYDIQGDFDNAYSAMRELSRVDVSVTDHMRASYLTVVASALIESGDRERSGKYLEKARKEDRSCTGALYLSAGLAMDSGELDRAAKRWEELLSIDMDYFPEVAPMLEKALFESGKFDELEGILSRLLAYYPSDPQLLASLAGYYAKKGEISRGIDLLENEKGRIASSSYLTISLASLYLKNGRTDEALSILEEYDRIPTALESWKCSSCGKTYGTNLGFCRICSSFNSIQKDETTQ